MAEPRNSRRSKYLLMTISVERPVGTLEHPPVCMNFERGESNSLHQARKRLPRFRHYVYAALSLVRIGSATGDFAAEAYPGHDAWQFQGGPQPTRSTGCRSIRPSAP